MPHADDFRNELYRMMLEAMKAGEAFAEINAGELHRRMGDYPGKNHRLPICCEVMRGALAPVILEQPPSGQESGLGNCREDAADGSHPSSRLPLRAPIHRLT